MTASTFLNMIFFKYEAVQGISNWTPKDFRSSAWRYANRNSFKHPPFYHFRMPPLPAGWRTTFPSIAKSLGPALASDRKVKKELSKGMCRGQCAVTLLGVRGRADRDPLPVVADLQSRVDAVIVRQLLEIAEWTCVANKQTELRDQIRSYRIQPILSTTGKASEMGLLRTALRADHICMVTLFDDRQGHCVLYCSSEDRHWLFDPNWIGLYSYPSEKELYNSFIDLIRARYRWATRVGGGWTVDEFSMTR
jgi:hypothetical protein